MITITPRNNWWNIDWKELWRFRELFFIFAWRDIKVRYKQTFLGIAWTVFQPVTTMIIFTVFFGKLARISSGKLPYSLFVLGGLVFWNFFSGVLSHASNSLIENENLIKKVYFPKIFLPLSSILVSFVDFTINLIILILYSLVLKFTPSIYAILIIPLAILLTTVTSAGLSLFTSALNVRFRDVRYILPFFIQILLFVTPVIYPLSIVSSTNKLIMALNPMTAVIDSSREALSGTVILNWPVIITSITSAVIIFASGLAYFKHTEKYIADII